MRRLAEELRASKVEAEASRKHIGELQRELAAERSEVHRLRQERRVTVQPPMTAPRAPHGQTSTVPPFSRQLEHPELESPRPPTGGPSAGAAPRRRELAKGLAWWMTETPWRADRFV